MLTLQYTPIIAFSYLSQKIQRCRKLINHHAHWVWHTKAHNCLTLSDSPQLLRSYESTGQITGAFEDEELCYFCGVADASYSHLATRCRRHLVYLKSLSALVFLDEIVARPRVSFSVQWNVHSWSPFDIDEENRTFTVSRGSSSVRGSILHQAEGFFSQTRGWDPPPANTKDTSQWHEQHNLRYTPTLLCDEQPTRLAVVLCPAHPGLSAATVRASSTSGGERADLGGWELLVRQEGDEMLSLRSNRGHYHVRDSGPGGRMTRADRTS